MVGGLQVTTRTRWLVNAGWVDLGFSCWVGVRLVCSELNTNGCSYHTIPAPVGLVRATFIAKRSLDACMSGQI
jgi:hypothetical protein